MKDANAEYVQKLRVNELAIDPEIQETRHQLFKTTPQGHSILTDNIPQGEVSSTNEYTNPSIIAATSIFKIQLDNVFIDSLYSLLQNKIPNSEIWLELSGGQKMFQ